MKSQTKFDDLQRRAVNEGIALSIPDDVIQTKRKRYLRDGKVVHRTELVNDSEYAIITRYQWAYRGLVEYYGMAQNLTKLGYLGTAPKQFPDSLELALLLRFINTSQSVAFIA
jgi:hypothetical protein